MLDFMILAQQCAPTVAPATMAALVRVESTGNPYAIGVVGGRLAWRPRTLEEALATAYDLHRRGFNFSVGIAQVNRFNLAPYGLTYTTAFDPCQNLLVGSKILEACYVQARPRHAQPLLAAFSCYYSGNFRSGFRPDKAGRPYVQKVVDAAGRPVPPIPVVPALPTRPVKGGPPSEAPVPLQRALPSDTPPPAPPPRPKEEEEPPKDPTMVF